MSITKVQRLKRIQLLYRQTRIETEVCTPCEKRPTSNQSNTSCRNCPVYKELKDIGFELKKLLNDRIREEHSPVAASGSIHDIENKSINLETYMKLRHDGLVDWEIAEELKIGLRTLVRWKSRNGLSQPYENRGNKNEAK